MSNVTRSRDEIYSREDYMVKEKKEMYQTQLIAIVTEKRNKAISTTLEVMELRYKIKDKILWITDHRGHMLDFDLEEFDVEIKMRK